MVERPDRGRGEKIGAIPVPAFIGFDQGST
jgi:hypothetical protein